MKQKPEPIPALHQQSHPEIAHSQNEAKKSELVLADVWLDKQDILQRMHISSGTLFKWRKKGLLPYSRIFGKIYYRESDLLKLLQSTIVSH